MNSNILFETCNLNGSALINASSPFAPPHPSFSSSTLNTQEEHQQSNATATTTSSLQPPSFYSTYTTTTTLKEKEHEEEEIILQSLEYWNNFIKKNYSPIIDMFSGLFMGEIICDKCKTEMLVLNLIISSLNGSLWLQSTMSYSSFSSAISSLSANTS